MTTGQTDDARPNQGPVAQAVANERYRCCFILKQITALKLPTELAYEMILNGTPMDGMLAATKTFLQAHMKGDDDGRR